MPSNEICENCGRQIGKLETPMLHDEHIVCMECYERLARANLPAKLTESDIYTPPRDLPTIPTMVVGGVVGTAPMIGAVTCRFCGNIGAPVRESRGSGLILLILLLCGVLPGIFYALAFNGYDIKCRRCRQVLAVDYGE